MSKNGHFKGKTYIALGGEKWSNVHSEDRCEGQICVIHNPSQHVMRQWRMHLRETGLVERMCEHGIGHPDPDSAAFFDRRYGHREGTWNIHGCDGCCADPYRTLD